MLKDPYDRSVCWGLGTCRESPRYLWTSFPAGNLIALCVACCALWRTIASEDGMEYTVTSL